LTPPPARELDLASPAHQASFSRGQKKKGPRGSARPKFREETPKKCVYGCRVAEGHPHAAPHNIISLPEISTIKAKFP